jgi:hypothetical protein
MILPAKLEEAALLTEFILRSKAYWGYSAAFMEAVRPIMTLKPEDIEMYPTYVIEDERG